MSIYIHQRKENVFCKVRQFQQKVFQKICHRALIKKWWWFFNYFLSFLSYCDTRLTSYQLKALSACAPTFFCAGGHINVRETKKALLVVIDWPRQKKKKLVGQQRLGSTRGSVDSSLSEDLNVV